MVQDRTSLRSAAVLAAKLLFAGLVFYGLWRARLLDFTQFPVLLHSPAPLVGAALMLFSTNILVSLRWHMLLAAQGIHVRRGQAFRVTYLASLAGVMLPGMVGGELVRVAMGRSFPRARIHELALSVVADRLVGLMALLLVGMTASLAFWTGLDSGGAAAAHLKMLMLGIMAFFVLAIGVAGAGAALAPRMVAHAAKKKWATRGTLLRIMADMAQAICLYRGKPGVLARALLLSLLVHVLVYSALTLVAVALHMAGSDPWKFTVAGVLAAVANALPLTPGGIGVGEAAFAQMILWLQPSSVILPYATVFLAFRMLTVITNLPALIWLPAKARP